MALSVAALALGLMLALALAEAVLRLWMPADAIDSPAHDSYWLKRYLARPPGVGAAQDLAPDPDLGWRPKAAYDAAGVHHNGLSLRGAHAPVPRFEGVRVLALGDSFTYGLGVRDEETFEALLERVPGVEVINAGVNGYGIDQAVLLWERLGRQLAPQLVVLGYYVDDFYRNGLGVRDWPKPRFLPDPATGGHRLLSPAESLRMALAEQESPSSRWRLVALARLAWEKVRNRLGLIDEARMRPLADLSHYLLQRLSGSVRESGARLVVIFIGHVHPGAPEHEWIEAQVMRSCGELKIDCIDMAAEMKGAERSAFYLPNAHWSALGHQFVARVIGERILLPEVTSRAASAPAPAVLPEAMSARPPLQASQ